ncbi:hypothetical protein ACFV4N_14310 [Actinosynnema sp. NPDC059797]
MKSHRAFRQAFRLDEAGRRARHPGCRRADHRQVVRLLCLQARRRAVRRRAARPGCRREWCSARYPVGHRQVSRPVRLRVRRQESWLARRQAGRRQVARSVRPQGRLRERHPVCRRAVPQVRCRVWC